MTPRRWIEYFIAILAGNAIYFAVVLPAMPGLSHEPFRLDLGLLVDFAICVLVYVAIRLGSRHARRLEGRNHPP